MGGAVPPETVDALGPDANPDYADGDWPGQLAQGTLTWIPEDVQWQSGKVEWPTEEPIAKGDWL